MRSIAKTVIIEEPGASVQYRGVYARGSLKVRRPTLFTNIGDHKSRLAMAEHIFEKVHSGAVDTRIDRRFPLVEAEAAHRAVEARQTTGSIKPET